jgi:hypothetical protein
MAEGISGGLATLWQPKTFCNDNGAAAYQFLGQR